MTPTNTIHNNPDIDPGVYDLKIGDLIVVNDAVKLINKNIAKLACGEQTAVIIGFRVGLDPVYLPAEEATRNKYELKIKHFDTFTEAHEAVIKHYTKWTTPDRVIISVYITDGRVLSLFPSEVMPVKKM